MSRTSWWRQPYPRYRAARTTSLLGSAISGISYPLLVLHLGGSVAEVGILSSCWMITGLTLRLPGGHLADLLDRRSIMITADAIRVAIVGAVPVVGAFGHLTYAQLLATAVLEAAGTAAFSPASAAFLRELVPREELPRALGQASGFGAAVSLLGPPLGGLCYGVTPMLPFMADAASYGLSGLLLFSVRLRPQHLPGGRPPVPSVPPAKGTPTEADHDRRVTAGFRWLLRRPAVVRILIFASVLNLATAATTVPVVVLLHQHGTSSQAIGIVIACQGAGGVVGSLLASRIMRLLDAPRLFATMGIAWTAGLGMFILWPSPWLFGPALVLMMALAPSCGVTLGTITMSEAPPRLLGRVNTAQQLLSLSLAAVGPLVGGLLLAVVGATGLWLTLGGLCLIATLSAVGPMFLAPAQPPASGAPADTAAGAEAGTQAGTVAPV